MLTEAQQQSLNDKGVDWARLDYVEAADVLDALDRGNALVGTRGSRRSTRWAISRARCTASRMIRCYWPSRASGRSTRTAPERMSPRRRVRRSPFSTRVMRMSTSSVGASMPSTWKPTGAACMLGRLRRSQGSF